MLEFNVAGGTRSSAKHASVNTVPPYVERRWAAKCIVASAVIDVMMEKDWFHKK